MLECLESMDIEFKELFGTPGAELELLFRNCTYPWQMLEKLNEFLQSLPLGQIQGAIDEAAIIRNKSLLHLGQGSEIGPGVLIEGPVYIGCNVKIRHGAYVRGPVFIDDDCIIGHASEVKHSILFKKASAAHFNYVGNSIIGAEAQLGAGATCANLRFDKKPISVRTKLKRITTEHVKMGAMIGEKSKIGCQAVLSPGAVLAIESIVHPLMSVQGYYDRKK